ncbi:hypothetical protein D9M68_973680 [compost metagenome]
MQNCPLPSVAEPTRPSATASMSAAPARVTTTGLTVPISAYTGMTTSRALAIRHRARPPACDPVKATAVISGASTSATPVSWPLTTANVPRGAPAAARASWAISA